MSYGYEEHLAMMRDERRMAAYAEAIRAVVRPGDVVLDLGAGAGILTFLALEAGASHVHAVEWSDNVEILARVAAAKGVADKIAIHRDDSRRVRLAAPADVLIADVRGALPIFGEGIAAITDARRRLLKPGGRHIPVSDRLWVAPVEHPEGHDTVTGWRRPVVEGYDCITAVAASRHSRNPFEAGALLAPAAVTDPFCYDGSTGADIRFAAEYVAARAGTCHGLGVWFEAELAPGVTLSTAPELATTVYGQAYFPVEQPAELAAGDRVRAELEIRTAPVEPVMLWSVSVESGESAGFRERRCSIDGVLMSVDALRKRGSDYTPVLGERGRAQLFALERMAQGITLGAIAEQLREAFPDRFGSVDDAAAYVGRLSQSFSE